VTLWRVRAAAASVQIIVDERAASK